MDRKTCATCGGSLAGLRRDAQFCKPSCRVLACQRRREERQTREAVRLALRAVRR